MSRYQEFLNMPEGKEKEKVRKTFDELVTDMFYNFLGFKREDVIVSSITFYSNRVTVWYDPYDLKLPSGNLRIAREAFEAFEAYKDITRQETEMSSTTLECVKCGKLQRFKHPGTYFLVLPCKPSCKICGSEMICSKKHIKNEGENDEDRG